VSERIPVYYTFGNHQHWVDFHWLWGYWVLGEATGDSLAYINATGTKGCVNFDGVGYEKLAAETPEDLAELRGAVAAGLLEPAGGSYGQPYGLFQGGEANVRQLAYGARALRKHLGQRPRTFWEEEFYFFPQLPQMLRGVGMPYASLYFQWTWHTPEVPWEAAPVVRWQGLDGSTVLAATRNALNLHQWPEDFQILLDQLADAGPAEVLRRGAPGAPAAPAQPPLILQWLELMPSPDWMCRSELMIPMMRRLLEDPRFDVRPCTLGEYLAMVEASGAEVPVRSYRMDEVWHGMSLGKNGYHMRRLSQDAELQALAAESLSAAMGLFGRPYAQWDVYPVWELEEAWRELLTGQHHDNDECERLCGYVGEFSYERSLALSEHVLSRTMKMLAQRAGLGEGGMILWNPLGWERRVRAGDEEVRLEPYGWACVTYKSSPPLRYEDDRDVRIEAPGLGPVVGFQDLTYQAGGRRRRAAFKEAGDGLYEARTGPQDVVERIVAWMDGMPDVLEVAISGDMERPDGGFAAGLRTSIKLPKKARLIADTAYGAGDVRPGPKRLRKYPSGDWMTSPQWFEEVEGDVYSQTFLDLAAPDGSGLLIVHRHASQWFVQGDELICQLSMADPWDEEHFDGTIETSFYLWAHGPAPNSALWRRAQEILRPPVTMAYPVENPYVDVPADLPRPGAVLRCEPPNVCVTAFHRETPHAGRGFADYAGAAIAYSYVIRLVEFDGMPADVALTLPGPVAKACRTNLLGEIEVELAPAKGKGPPLPGIEWQTLRFAMRPHEIATVYADLKPGRKRFRDLDAHRKVWATVHRRGP
jgi:alpha-mannosidase